MDKFLAEHAVPQVFHTVPHIKNMELRDYQKECIGIIEAKPPGSYLCQMPTGCGKTATFTHIPRHGGRVLVLAHREELVRQPARYYDCPVGFEIAKDRSHGEDVVIASVQSLVNRLDRFAPDEFDKIITDEAHHAAAGTYKKIYDHFTPEKHSVGLHPALALRDVTEALDKLITLAFKKKNIKFTPCAIVCNMALKLIINVDFHFHSPQNTVKFAE